MGKSSFSKNELDRIAKAVKEAEEKTSGEISVAFIKESSDYAKYELLFAIICGFIYTAVLMLFRTGIEEFIRRLFWDFSTSHLVIFHSVSPFIVITLFYFIANISFIDRIIIPGKVMERTARERASRYFFEAGITNTKERTGILIFLSFLERQVVLIADTGINSIAFRKRSPEIISNIISGIKTGDTIGKLAESIELCGKLVAEEAPIKPDDENELKNEVSILEK